MKKLLPHAIIVLVFIVISVGYFTPVLQGKKIFQSDIVWFNGMAKEQRDFIKKTGEEPYWTNSAFGGMPTYQLGANYPHDYIKKLDRIIRFLPRPADYLFLYFIGFYILLLVLKIDYKLAFLGALAFGFSTYLIIIIGVGHNAKAHAIGYFPIILAGILLAFRQKYITGFLLTAFGMALEISANHIQMTYYLMLLVLAMGVVYAIEAVKEKEIPRFLKTCGILVVAVVLAVLTNATNLMATKEYAAWSTRGTSELTINPDGSPKKDTDGLDKEYITQYSYGILETLDLFVPRLFGGSNHENLGEKSKTYDFLLKQGVPRVQALDFAESLPSYWGKQPGVAGPAYIGAVILFLFVMALFLVKGKAKRWLLAGVLLSLLLSWGKNFSLLTDLMIDYFPMYNKFRAVSSIQVILELCIPVLAILGLARFLDTSVPEAQKERALKWTAIITLGVVVLLFLGRGTFDFIGDRDEMIRQYYGNEIVDMIRADRKAMYGSDLLRTLIFIALSAGVLWFYLKGRLKYMYAVAGFTALVLFDLGGVAKRYVNKDDFVQAKAMDVPFQATPVDKEILKDTTYYRVYEPSQGLNGSRASYFHHSVGGYHAAKPGKLQELFQYQVVRNNMEVLNMLNVKYIIQKDNEGKLYPARNPDAAGNAWFVKKLTPVNNADAEMNALDSLNIKNEAVFDHSKFKGGNAVYDLSPGASISLVEYKPNFLKYVSDNPNDGLAVFSEMYYPHGWKAMIDGKEVPFFRVNYTLRGMQVPAGKHTIEFRFKPEVVEKGSTIALAGNIILGLLLLGGIFLGKKRGEKVRG
ncbi:YfhO family protein [Sinomicrobium weinanense]|uniref:YfhO family protein n=1 Tax=Sinomicrobium weinanense TaxID=2842200 RepID=A0A926JQL5_9FLAO|nr:YfhO family protein [Sinomicrobium weinanense]MBU3122812.1 YfhO family protein [Sinomicrobium weinanense]